MLEDYKKKGGDTPGTVAGTYNRCKVRYEVMQQLFKVNQQNIPLSVPVNRILPLSEFIIPRAHERLTVLLYGPNSIINIPYHVSLGCSWGHPREVYLSAKLSHYAIFRFRFTYIILLSSDLFLFLHVGRVRVSSIACCLHPRRGKCDRSKHHQ